MSSKTLALNTLTQQFKKWPQDSKRVYASFKDFQTKQLQKAFESPESKLPSAENLNSQAAATRTLINETNNNKFTVLESLLRPSGMPNYYERIAKEAGLDTRKKESLFKSVREAVFGWFK